MNSYKNNAQEALRWLREGYSNPDGSISYLRRYLDKGKLTLEDIGTSEKELERLRNKTG